MKQLRSVLTAESLIRYLVWRALRLPRELTVTLDSGLKLILRPLPADDLYLANQIHVSQCYRSPRLLPPDSIRRIVDLGANVGYTCLYWRRMYPAAHVTAFEPHPRQAAMLRRNLELNHQAQHVTVHQAAATTADGDAFLSDQGMRSTLFSQRASSLLSVPSKDFFSLTGSAPIDLLKLDIEGGEYEILSDPRFASLSAQAIVLEWHQTPEHSDGGDWCRRILAGLGYELEEGHYAGATTGLLWAYLHSSQKSARNLR